LVKVSLYGERMTILQDAVARLARQGKQFFTTRDLVEVLQVDRLRAQQIAFRMAEAGLATRLKRGTYALAPADAWGEPGAVPTNWYAAAAALVHPAPYYLAYYTAMRLHRMTQHPLRTVFIAITRPRRDVAVGPVRFQFVTLADHRFFGQVDHVLEPGRVVKVADLERTFLDCVDRPDLCGGLEEIVGGFKRQQHELNADRLLRYVMRLREPALTKRLGFLLELTGYGDPEVLWELERIAGRAKRYIPLDVMRRDRTGLRNKRWELVLNADIDELLRVGKT
jgi:predicted transcriptional regulator of viral defense system